MPKRLVVLGANLTALAVARSAHRQGIRPVVVDVEDGPAFDSRLVDQIRRVGSARSALVNQILDSARAGAAWLVSSSDAWTVEIQRHRAVLDQHFERVLHPSNEVLDICLNKEAFASWCEKNDVPTPMTHRVPAGCRSASMRIQYPVLVRPAETLHSRPVAGVPKAAEFTSWERLEPCLQLFRDAGVTPVITQSLLGRPLTQLSVGAACTGGRVLTVTSRKIRPRPQACRVGTLVETAHDPEAETLVVETLLKLGYEGIAEVELLRTEDDGRLHVIEVNARPWLQFALGAASGRDLLGFFLVENASSHSAPSRRRVWLDFSADLYGCFGRDDGLVRDGKISYPAYFASVWRADVFARWSASDPGPFLRGFWQLLQSVAQHIAGKLTGSHPRASH